MSNFEYESQNCHEETEENYEDFQSVCLHSNNQVNPGVPNMNQKLQTTQKCVCMSKIPCNENVEGSADEGRIA
jgi:hypothetical protein